MNECIFCGAGTSPEGVCPNCGQTLGRFTMHIPFSTRQVTMTVTTRYLIFTGAGSIKGRLGAGFAGSFLGGLAGGMLADDLYDAHSAKRKPKEVGMLDLGAITYAAVCFPSSKMHGPTVYFRFVNGRDLYLGIFGERQRFFAEELLKVLRGMNVPADQVDCKTSDDYAAANPIADKDALTRTVSHSAAAFLPPFPDRIDLTDL